MKKLENTQLQHVTPESVGIKSGAIKAFIDEINEKKLGLQSFTVVRHDKVCAQGFFKPYSADYPHVLYSMSKSVTSTAVALPLLTVCLKQTIRCISFSLNIKTQNCIRTEASQ